MSVEIIEPTVEPPEGVRERTQEELHLKVLALMYGVDINDEHAMRQWLVERVMRERRERGEPDTPERPSMMRFYLEHGRMPHLGVDPVPPWRYKGWMLWQVQLAHYHPAVPNRWAYWLDTMENGALLPAPIPQMHFGDDFHGGQGALRAIEKWESIVQHEGGWSSFNNLIEWFAFALGVADEPSRLSDKVQEQLYRTVDFSHFLLSPGDHLGGYMAQRTGKGWNPNAFYPTPHNVVEMMTRMVMHDEGENRAATFCEPCVGTGRMLLHASNHIFRLYGMDKDPLVIQICKINMAFYVPWALAPFPDEFFTNPEAVTIEHQFSPYESKTSPRAASETFLRGGQPPRRPDPDRARGLLADAMESEEIGTDVAGGIDEMTARSDFRPTEKYRRKVETKFEDPSPTRTVKLPKGQGGLFD